jgi:hypothetical protein
MRRSAFLDSFAAALELWLSLQLSSSQVEAGRVEEAAGLMFRRVAQMS